MNDLVIKLTTSMYQEVLRDLSREHAYAAERCGFVLARSTQGGRQIFLTKYMSIEDRHYGDNPNVGAEIDGEVLREVLKEAYKDKCGVFHVHMHADFGTLGFSSTDLHFFDGFMPALKGVSSSQPHGALLFDGRRGIAKVWSTDGKIVSAARIIIVGPKVLTMEVGP